ncbi:tail fiber domain-containing protein [Segatella copri]|uniref:tail fiber domain-containing protein n=1 Tax=Segatella copri TaxID=165179 RepID=UPI0019337DBC|nr:tail fiber domain-containing protein [Segatella copri]MBM0154233.1 tail fiber domain-containing protein [Segatella copri]
MIKIYDINDKLLMQAEVTSAAKREQEMSKSDYISLSFSAAEKVILPIGAYINYTYKIDKVREVTRKFLLLESYEPTQSDECSWKYTPQFQHPKMILSKTPFFIYTRNSQNVEVKQNVWSFVGTTSALSEKIKDFLNKDLMFGECGWKVIFSNVTANTVNVSFSDNDFISALTAITNAIGDNCEWHIDYDDEIIYIGKVLIGATPVVLEVGKNVGVPSINNSKEGYYNAFSIFGGTRNITQVNSKGENVSSGDIRLQLDEGNGTILIDGKERSYSIDKYSTLDLRADKTKEPLFTKVLDFSQIYPSLNTYVYNVRGRVKYVLDDNNKKIPISYNADGSVKEYKTFTVWYMKLAYPATEKVEGKTIINTTVDDGVTHYWYDFEVTDDLLINGKNIGCSFEPNFNTGALSTPLAGRGSNGEYVGFELIYHKEASSSHTSDDVSDSNFSVLAGDYEIIYQEDNEVIIPTNEAEMLIPRGESKPSLKCNITVLYNIAMADTIYYEDAQNRLLEKAKEEIVRLLSDLNNYEVKSYSDVFLEDNPQLQIGQSITYKDGHGYELATRVLKLSTNIDYDFIQSITIGNQVIKGTITQLKEDVQTIIASGGSSGNGGGYSVSQLRKLIAKYGSDNFISKQFDDIAKGTITWEKLQKFLKGMKVGANGDWTLDELDNTHLTTDYLQVRMKAIFETLEILHTDTLGGELFITPVGSNRILKVEEVNITYDGVSQKAYRCYFLGEQDGSKVENKWKVGDQARSKSFNLTAGKYHNVGNHYYWRLVIGVSSEAVEIDGKKYHYVDLSDIDKDAASDEPMVDDILNQCGNRTNITRQSCLVFSAVDTYSPCITLYHGVDGYTFNNKEYVNYGVNHSTNKAFFHVYGDMYFGDRPTSANNYEGESYVKFDSETKKVTIKGELDIKSTYDGKTLDKYIADKRRIFGSQPVPPYDVNDMWVNATYPSDGSTYKNEILKCSTAKAEGEKFDIADWKLASKYTDDTKAEEAKKAAEKAQEEIKTTQSNLNTLGTTVSNNKKAFDDFTSDGYLDSSEIAAIAQDSKRLEDDYNAAVESYNNVVGSKFLLDKDGNETTYKTDLVSAKATLDSAKNELITYLSDIVSRYNASDSNGKATIKAAAAQKYTNFTNAYKAFYDKLGVANNYITSNLFDGLNTKLITNMAGLEYIKAALVDGDTVVKGGLILSTLIALRNDKGNVTAGINGADTKENGIALWLGGKAIDKQASTTTEEEKKIAAKSLLRFDGTGYFANGNLWWDADGILHADPTSFIINKNNVGVQLALFAPIWKSGTTDTTKLANVLSIDPQKPFTHLDVSGNVTTEGSLKIGGIYLSYDSANNALRLSKDAAGKEAANFYALGGITAYGKGAGTTGGGGLNASVISYARIIKGDYTDADLTSIPNAYAIKALSSRIDNIATELGGLNLSWNNITGKPSTFTPSAHTHKWTEITDRITKVSQLTNDKGYLTAHQSLASYYTKAEIDAKGYTTNKGTVTSVALTLPTGLTCATKVITTSGTFAISLASGYSIPTTAKQTAWDGAVSAKHTHSNKSVLDGITSTKVTCWDNAYDWYALITTDEETADGVINKWNEVVSFLANIAQTDTLSGIVDGINKSISDEVTRAKKAEGVNASGISTNKTSITTLQGYFTSGSAKKALQLTNTRKLWGNSFNGTADINGSIIVPDGKYISIGNIKMEYDATNKALKITNTTTNEVANLYTSGGVSAYGVGTSSSSGGGLNGSVKSYSNALKLTSESLSEIASAYSIKALDSRISSLEGGSATAISVSGSGNAVTSVTKNGTTISVVKGSTFLTNHQSLDGYVNAISVSGSGNAITSVSKSGKGITFTKGATFLTSHQSLANYYTKSSVDSLLSGKSATSHTHSVKINGVTKTIAASGGAAVDLGTYLTSHQSLNGYATQSWVKSQGYLTSHQDISILNMANDRYYTKNVYGINMRNSDIIGVNSIYTDDLSDNPSEAILFYRSNGNYDGIRARNGVLYFSNNVVRTTSKYDAEYEVYHKGNLTKLSQLTNDKNFVTGSVSGQTITINGVSTTWQNTWRGITDSYSGTSTGTSLSQKGANSLYNALHNGYASSAGNADTLDGYHANGSNVAPYGHIPTIESDGGMEVGKYIDFHNDNSGKHDFSTRLQSSGNYGNSVNLPSNSGTLALISDNVASATKLQTPRTIWGQSFDGTGNVSGNLSKVGNIHFKVDNSYDIGSNDAASRYIYTHWLGARSGRKLELGANDSGFGQGLCLDTNLNVGIGTNSPAYKLHVVGDIYSTASIRTIFKDKAIILSDSDNPAWISALAGQIIFDTGKAIRFGETDWNWNKWAGLKYTHSNKTIYLGIADGSAFTALSPQNDGTLKFPGITTITPDSGARIGGSGGDLYLGNGNNTNWVKVQDICSQAGSTYWQISQSGNASFKSLNVNNAISFGSITINGDTRINGSTTINSLLTAKAIKATTADVNAFGTSLNNWDGSIAANVTNMFNGIPMGNIQVEYSMDNGATWNAYPGSPENAFNLVNDNVNANNYYLGLNNIIGNTDADKLVQIKKNQLRVTVKIPAEIYQELCWISVDVNNGVNIKCQVYYGNSNGVYTERVSKIMYGWSHKCDICVGQIDAGVGYDSHRYVRFVFSHPSNNTNLRNGIVAKIRALALTKFARNTDRYTISTTGHIYDYDAYMNTYFPNSILAKGGVTAYQSSDIRLKQDLRKLDYLGIIKAMGGTFSFAWKKDNTRSIGWIAQHVLCNPHLKDIVETDEKGYYKINYWSPKLIATAFGAIEQVGDEVSRLKARVVFLESEVLRLSGDKEDCNKKRLDNKNINSLN